MPGAFHEGQWGCASIAGVVIVVAGLLAGGAWWWLQQPLALPPAASGAADPGVDLSIEPGTSPRGRGAGGGGRRRARQPRAAVLVVPPVGPGAADQGRQLRDRAGHHAPWPAAEAGARRGSPAQRDAGGGLDLPPGARGALESRAAQARHTWTCGRFDHGPSSGRPGMHPEGRFFPDTYTYAKGSSDLAVLRARPARDGQEAGGRLGPAPAHDRRSRAPTRR